MLASGPFVEGFRQSLDANPEYLEAVEALLSAPPVSRCLEAYNGVIDRVDDGLSALKNKVGGVSHQRNWEQMQQIVSDALEHLEEPQELPASPRGVKNVVGLPRRRTFLGGLHDSARAFVRLPWTLWHRPVKDRSKVYAHCKTLDEYTNDVTRMALETILRTLCTSDDVDALRENIAFITTHCTEALAHPLLLTMRDLIATGVERRLRVLSLSRPQILKGKDGRTHVVAQMLCLVTKEGELVPRLRGGNLIIGLRDGHLNELMHPCLERALG